MAGLKRSAVSFRRQGSSGLVWDDHLLKAAQFDQPIQTKPIQLNHRYHNNQPSSPTPIVPIPRSRSFRTGNVSATIDPPSPKVSACGFCGAFEKRKYNTRRCKPNSGA